MSAYYIPPADMTHEELADYASHVARCYNDPLLLDMAKSLRDMVSHETPSTDHAQSIIQRLKDHSL